MKINRATSCTSYKYQSTYTTQKNVVPEGTSQKSALELWPTICFRSVFLGKMLLAWEHSEIEERESTFWFPCWWLPSAVSFALSVFGAKLRGTQTRSLDAGVFFNITLFQKWISRSCQTWPVNRSWMEKDIKVLEKRQPRGSVPILRLKH